MTVNASQNYILSRYISNTWARPVLLYVNPPITILGMMGNTFCFVTVLSRKLYNKSPVFVFFLFLAFTDFLYVISDGIYTHEYSLGMEFHSRYDSACQWLLFVAHIGLVSSSWLLVSVTAFKLYGLAMPLSVIQRNRPYTPYIVCTAVIVTVGALKINVFWTVGVVTERLTDNLTISMCFYPDPYVATQYSTAFMMAYSIGPGCLLVILSSGICIMFVVSLRQHNRLVGTSSSDTRMSSTYATVKNSVAMLLPLSFIHIVCTFPLLVYITFYSTHHASPEFFFLTDRFWLLNHCMNVYVQLAVSRFYREAMLPCVVKHKTPARG